MGTYGYGEFLETFGGEPEPGETFPDDPDAVREAMRCEHCGRTGGCRCDDEFEEGLHGS